MIGDIGPTLLGVAAIMTAAGGVLRKGKHGKLLDEINHAVNNVGEGAPPLWQRIDAQTAHIGGLSEKIDAHIIADEKYQDITQALFEGLQASHAKAWSLMTLTDDDRAVFIADRGLRAAEAADHPGLPSDIEKAEHTTHEQVP